MIIDLSSLSRVAFTFKLSSLHLDIYWYAILYCLGIAASFSYACYVCDKNHNILTKNKTRYRPPTSQDISDNSLLIIVSIIISARLGYALFYDRSLFMDNFFSLRNGGLSFHGSFFFMPLIIYIIFVCKKISPISTIDIVAMSAPVGIIFGRLGNFLTGEIYGKETMTQFGVIFPCHQDMNTCYTPRHPVQLYEMFLEGFVIFLIIYIINNRYAILSYPGCTTALSTILYGTMRIICQQFRDYHHYTLFPQLGISTGTLLSIIMIIMGVLYFMFLVIVMIKKYKITKQKI